jgi:hypothetical protein
MMTRPAFTPGPWRIHPDDRKASYNDYRIVASDGATIVSRGYEGLDGGVENHDDALLIAAAPDLYLQLNELLADICPFGIGCSCDSAALHDDARAALAKADGR